MLQNESNHFPDVITGADTGTGHPETPRTGPLSQGAMEAETLAAPVMAEPVAPEPVIAPEVQ